MTLTVRPIDPAEHAAFVAAQPSVSYLHTAQWASIKSPEQATALGFYDDDTLVGVGLAQYLRTFLGRKAAYLPDGPYVRWDDVDPAEALGALERWLQAEGCFEVRIGPFVPWKTWSNETLKHALADEADSNLFELPPDHVDERLSLVERTLRERGWHPAPEANTNDGQNGYNFFIDVSKPTEEILAGMNQMYRRNIKKAQKGGVVVRQGGAEDLATFHRQYQASGEREGFFVLPLEYFTTQFAAFDDSRDHCRVFVAELDGEPLAAAVWIKVGDHVWYTRGGSSDVHRELRAVNILQWAMIEAAHDAGAKIYDMGGIYPWINASSRGLLQFKVGTGGYGSGTLNEWTKSLAPVTARLAHLAVSGRRRARKLPGRVKSSLSKAPATLSQAPAALSKAPAALSKAPATARGLLDKARATLPR